jgi:hypothetical protein
LQAFAAALPGNSTYFPEFKKNSKTLKNFYRKGAGSTAYVVN